MAKDIINSDLNRLKRELEKREASIGNLLVLLKNSDDKATIEQIEESTGLSKLKLIESLIYELNGLETATVNHIVRTNGQFAS